MRTAIGVVTCNHCGNPLDPETLTCDCMDDIEEWNDADRAECGYGPLATEDERN